ncbi:MAG: isopentenyl-diphosphate Delta-isomerase [Flavobacteriales bacterium]|nr:isopentenyl-diphosphate Delta-isomerase [Flavobacteriales bacterium]
MKASRPGPLEERVVLVNEKDEELGSMEKLEAHRTGTLHRAFSVFLFDANDRLLLQRRAFGKYHSPGLWTNTCCSHPRVGESIMEAAHRRLMEEMGLKASLEHRFSFAYRADVGQGLIEHELDHVLFGRMEGRPEPDPAEVMDVRLIDLDDLEHELHTSPGSYTAWLRACWSEVAAQRAASRA